MRNSTVMRTTSNFDTHIGIQQREKYFDKLGLNASVTTTGTPSDLNTPKLESRRLSRGLSSLNMNVDINPTQKLSEVSMVSN
jgi:hypothetical protein